MQILDRRVLRGRWCFLHFVFLNSELNCVAGSLKRARSVLASHGKLWRDLFLFDCSQNNGFVANQNSLFVLKSRDELKRVKIFLRDSIHKNDGFAFLELRSVFVTVLALSDARRDHDFPTRKGFGFRLTAGEPKFCGLRPASRKWVQRS